MSEPNETLKAPSSVPTTKARGFEGASRPRLNHAELLALSKLCAEVDRMGLPVRLELRDDYLQVHFTGRVSDADEAHLLNVASHGARCCRLDPWQGPALPPAMFRQRHDAWVAEHPVTRKPTRERS